MHSPVLRPLVDSIPALFFSLSGFLIAGSLERCRTVIFFAGLRIFRLFPALVVEVSLSALILGPLLTNIDLPSYLRGYDFSHYFRNMVGDIHYRLPGVFTDNPFPSFVNGQLWTVPYELRCYEVLLVIAVIGASRSRVLLVGTVALVWLVALHSVFDRLAGARE
jgi:peptidoglycan/LPS O-acetylase OafA/YrhL